VKNNGNVPATLNMTSTNWEPTNVKQCLALTWNLENYTLNDKDVAPAELRLAVLTLPENITSFTFTAVITGTES
jgi:hypothetical protein